MTIRGENEELCVGVRRAMGQQGNVPSPVISSHSMHLGVLVTAWDAFTMGKIFTVYYKPRFVPYALYRCKEATVSRNKYHWMYLTLWSSFMQVVVV